MTEVNKAMHTHHTHHTTTPIRIKRYECPEKVCGELLWVAEIDGPDGPHKETGSNLLAVLENLYSYISQPAGSVEIQFSESVSRIRHLWRTAQTDEEQQFAALLFVAMGRILASQDFLLSEIGVILGISEVEEAANLLAGNSLSERDQTIIDLLRDMLKGTRHHEQLREARQGSSATREAQEAVGDSAGSPGGPD